MGKGKKATKKFAASGQLKKSIQARQKAKQIKTKIQTRRGHKEGKGKELSVVNDAETGPKQKKVSKGSKNAKRMTVDDFLNGGFMEVDDEEDIPNNEELGTEDQNAEGGYDSDDNTSFASVDDFDEEGEHHLLELSKLAEKDPEFFKYLQENDRELLEFDPSSLPEPGFSETEDRDGDVDMDAGEDIPILTKEHLRRWQKSLLQQHSLRALRKLLVAFRSAAHLNKDGQILAWTIDNSSTYNKLVNTALRYTPIVLEYHVPYKTLPNGKFKPPSQTQKFRTLQKLILSHFSNVTDMLSQLTEEDMLRLALTESAKLVPYIVTSRKSVKTYLKQCLDLWSTGVDGIRLAAFLCVRRLAASSDESILDTILKSIYLTLVRASKSTTAYTLPSINLMKNSSSDVFCLDHTMAYQHAFGYIRQLAIHLRNSMKIKTKEAYKNVYNWQFVHSVDFWCIVLGRACDMTSEAASGKESQLRPLIYPLVQVSLGAIKLVPNGRSYPFHLQIIRSLLHLSKRTQTYIPLSPYLFPILSACVAPSSRPKSSTLKALDFDTQIRIPQQYIRTRVLSEGLAEEAAFLLTEWLASVSVHGSIGFPEIVVPVVVLLRRSLKNSNLKAKSSGKEHGIVKTMLERVEESARWIEQKRSGVTFSPSKVGNVQEWEEEIRKKLHESPLGKYLKIQRKAREKRQSLNEKAREGKDEIVEEED